jgi:hypothetical protein
MIGRDAQGKRRDGRSPRSFFNLGSFQMNRRRKPVPIWIGGVGEFALAATRGDADRQRREP